MSRVRGVCRKERRPAGLQNSKPAESDMSDGLDRCETCGASSPARSKWHTKIGQMENLIKGIVFTKMWVG